MNTKFLRGILILAMAVTLPVMGLAQEKTGIKYDLWAKVLKGHVNDLGLVDYEKLKSDPADLEKFIHLVENADIQGWSRNEKKVFWINAYNALTLKLIVDKYPLKLGGIRTINWGRPWSIKMKAAGRELTLGDIEHEILRKWDPADPRIHFAINCASLGCPKLPAKPFEPERLDQQLHYETKRFINDPEKVKLDWDEGVLYYSAIFKWFEEDFLVVADDIPAYIKKYINEEDRAFLEGNEIDLKVLKYDWGLNKQ